MTITLRPATAADLDFLDALHTACMKPHVERVHAWDPAFFRREFDPATITVIQADGVATGMVKATEDEEAVGLRQISIAPTFQSQGIGAAVLRQIVRNAHGRGLPVRLQVIHGNPARRLYERLGFRVVAETPDHHIMSTDSAQETPPPASNTPAEQD